MIKLVPLKLTAELMSNLPPNASFNAASDVSILNNSFQVPLLFLNIYIYALPVPLIFCSFLLL